MNDNAAANLVKTTFENPYNRERFLAFAKNIFKSFNESKAFHARGYVKEKFKKTIPVIKTYERFGTFTDENDNKIDILVVYLEKDDSLDRARTAQRNFVGDYLKQRDAKEAALVAFVPPTLGNWRLSLVKMDYHLAKSQSGKLKAITELTPARRFSFLVGKDENTHTAQRQLLPVLQMDEHPLRLADLENAFSVEVVTKDFFEKYKKLFLDTKKALDKIIAKDSKIKADFTEKNIDTVNFAKKLLGQIVFLYFLQKKGWFGVARDENWGTGPKGFLRRLFEKQLASYDNFFDDILEPLFYEALAIERPDDFYSKFNCKIPFLNGGLFDPLGNYDWIHTDIRLSDKLFSNNERTKEGDIGTGILDVFDRYNFTVKEDEPLEREVAVDPEMLGKVFENLLEVKDRKSKGTYYTPREIVHYMCQESLVNYLTTETDGKVKRNDIETLIRLGETVVEHDSRVVAHGEETDTYQFKLPQSIRKNASLIDESLEKIKACDPAAGSGAFLVGMMTEIIRARNTLSSYLPKNNRSIYTFKRHAIQNCLYGVDIDPGAVEIAKLRLWLSLIVDEQDIKQIKPLPNLDYKIMQGNSLIEFLSPDLVRKGVDREKNNLIDKLNELKDRFFDTHALKEKQDLRARINKLILEIANYDKIAELKKLQSELGGFRQQEKLLELPGDNLELFSGHIDKKKIEKLKKKAERLEEIKDTTPENHFEWHLNFNEVFEKNDGFDVVIANPPYVKEYVNKSAFDSLRNSPYYQGKMDLWYLFTCMGIDLLKNAGVICFIAQNNWVTSYGASKMRNKVVEDTQILSLIDFGEYKIFEAGIQTMVMIFKKNTDTDGYSLDYRRLKGSNLTFNDVVAALNKDENGKVEYLAPKINRNEFGNKKLTFSAPEIESILQKIYSGANFHLDPKREVAQGIVCPQDSVNRSSQKTLGDDVKVGDGIFILSDYELQQLDLSSSELSIIKPLYTTYELKRWRGNSKNKRWIIYTDSSFKKEKIKKFQTIKKHLDRYKKVITSDNKPYGLHRARNEYFFKGEKIIAVRKCAIPTFTYTDFDVYVTATFYIIKTNKIDQKYLLALLNSKLMTFWLRHKGKMQGNNFQIDKDPLVNLPLQVPDESTQDSIRSIVDKILNTLESTPENQVKVKNYEKEIDQLVYKLYDLTPEEIKTVEKNTKIN